MKRSGPPVRKKGLTRTGLKQGVAQLARVALRTDPAYRIPARSKKTRAEEPARAACRAEVIERDVGDWELGERLCVLHAILATQGHPQHCGARDGQEPEVHEIITRGRGGSKTDPANCVALCHAAHAWVTAHPTGAEALGLMLPSWASPEIIEDAARRRESYTRRPLGVAVPWWRPATEAADFRAAIVRDLAALGWAVS